MPATKKTVKKVSTTNSTEVKVGAASKAKVAVKKPAVKKAEGVKLEAVPSGALTRVIAKVDAGWGNQLYIRGNGGGLSWEKGVLLQCINDDEWLWEKKVSEPKVSFKVLLNDEIWAVGEDIIVASGETSVFTPCFIL